MDWLDRTFIDGNVNGDTGKRLPRRINEEAEDVYVNQDRQLRQNPARHSPTFALDEGKDDTDSNVEPSFMDQLISLHRKVSNVFNFVCDAPSCRRSSISGSTENFCRKEALDNDDELTVVAEKRAKVAISEPDDESTTVTPKRAMVANSEPDGESIIVTPRRVTINTAFVSDGTSRGVAWLEDDKDNDMDDTWHNKAWDSNAHEFRKQRSSRISKARLSFVGDGASDASD